METRANYVLIGAVTVLAILAGLAFVLWLGKAQLDRSYAQYDVLFDSVEGLGRASPVRYNGVDVGQVLTIALDEQDPARVRVRLEVEGDTPVRQNTVATLSSQGVTGVSFVALEGGTADAPALAVDPGRDVPVIPSKPSLVQDLIEGAPDLLNETRALLRELNGFVGPENQAVVADILRNVADATGRLDDAMTDFSSVSASIDEAVREVARFTRRLDAVAANADATLTTAREAIGKLTVTAEQTVTIARDALTEFSGNANATMLTLRGGVSKLVADADATLTTARGAIGEIDEFVGTGLPRLGALANEAARLIGALSQLTARIERDPARFLLGTRSPEYSR